MLGLGRALGETMAVAMVLSASGVVTVNLISATNPSTIAANIALTFNNAQGKEVNVLIFSGLVLFVITFVRQLRRAGRRRPLRDEGHLMPDVLTPELAPATPSSLQRSCCRRWAPILVGVVALAAAGLLVARHRLVVLPASS